MKLGSININSVCIICLSRPLIQQVYPRVELVSFDSAGY